MGWDNASTVARDVENPQRNYPRAMIGAATLTAFTYVLPLAAMARGRALASKASPPARGPPPAASLGGPLLAMAVVAGGVICGVGMFNALMMSYTRLPIAMAADGMLPRIFRRRNRRGVPWVSVLACGLAWALALNLPFERLISIDLILYGSSLLLEFVALIALRLREPQLPRPFRAGNFAFACLLAVGPTVLIAYALYASRSEKLGDPNTALANVSSLLFASAIGLLRPAALLAHRCPTCPPASRTSTSNKIAPLARQLNAVVKSASHALIGSLSLFPIPCLSHCNLLLRLVMLRLARPANCLIACITRSRA